MATKASTRKPASSGRKKPAGSRAKTGARSKSGQEQVRRSRQQASAIVLFTAGILLAAIAAISGSNLWLLMHQFLYGLFGAAVWLIPAALIYIAIMATLDKPLGEIRHKLWQTGILELLVCALAEICSSNPFPGTGFFDGIMELYDKGRFLKGGGVAGGLLGWPLNAACGKVGAVIIISLFLFAFVMLLTGATLIGLFKGIAKPVQKVNESYVQRREEREAVTEEKRERREERKRANRFNIDVDLGPEEQEDTPPEPAPTAPPRGETPAAREADRLWEQYAAPELPKEPSAPKPPPEEQKPSLEVLLEEERKQAAVSAEAVSSVRTAKPVLEVSEVLEAEEAPSAPDAPPEPLLPAEEPIPALEERDPAVDELVNKALSFQREEEPVIPVEPVFDRADQAKLYVGGEYVFPPVGLLKAPKPNENQDVSGELRANADLLVDTLKSFGVQTKVIDISRGPTVTRYELQPSAGVKISRITGLADDIALNLAAAGVRIEAPIPNKPAVGIEVPNRKTDVVTMREIIETREFEQAKSKLSFALGRDITGAPVIADIAKTPHMLIAGPPGPGKSVCINSIIISLLYKSSPSEVRFLMIDPKVVELGVYNGIPHLLVPVVTDPRKAAGALGWAVTEMLNRYKLFAENNVRDFFGYNALAEEKPELAPMPQVVIIIDELADLMMAAPNEVEDAICRLAQMARAAGMHLVIATQRPSVDVITGIIKANIPSRIAFAVSSTVDSRTILDAGGAEKLLGRGDMLFAPLGYPKPVRVQGCFVSDKEVEQVTEFIKNSGTADYDDKVLEEIERQAVSEKGSGGSDGGGFDDSDELLNDAVECVIEAGQASASYLQRKLKVGYARAARLIDEMESKGIVGAFEGSKPRPVIITRQQWIEMNMNQDV